MLPLTFDDIWEAVRTLNSREQKRLCQSPLRPAIMAQPLTPEDGSGSPPPQGRRNRQHPATAGRGATSSPSRNSSRSTWRAKPPIRNNHRGRPVSAWLLLDSSSLVKPFRKL